MQSGNEIFSSTHVLYVNDYIETANIYVQIMVQPWSQPWTYQDLVVKFMSITTCDLSGNNCIQTTIVDRLLGGKSWQNTQTTFIGGQKSKHGQTSSKIWYCVLWLTKWSSFFMKNLVTFLRSLYIYRRFSVKECVSCAWRLEKIWHMPYNLKHWLTNNYKCYTSDKKKTHVTIKAF